MATQESMAIRANAACERIETVLAGMGVEVAPLPRLMKDREMLRCVQLEQIAAMLEQVQGNVVPPIVARFDQALQKHHEKVTAPGYNARRKP